jgi:hypothetical protein
MTRVYLDINRHQYFPPNLKIWLIYRSFFNQKISYSTLYAPILPLQGSILRLVGLLLTAYIHLKLYLSSLNLKGITLYQEHLNTLIISMLYRASLLQCQLKR